MSTLVEFSIAPVGKGESLSPYVSRAVSMIEKSGLDYQFGPMGTCIEGEWDDVMGLIRSCFQDMNKDCDRISMLIKVDYRKDKKGRIKDKIASVKNKLSL